MISQHILKYKPRIRVGSVQNQAPSNDNWPYPKTNYPTSQEEYDAYLKDVSKFVSGDFLVFDSISKYSPLRHWYQIHLVVAVQKDFNKVSKKLRTAKPEPYYIHSMAHMANGAGDPWKRWDDCEGMRVLTAEEYEEWIKPNNDQLQDYFKTARKLYQSGD